MSPCIWNSVDINISNFPKTNKNFILYLNNIALVSGILIILFKNVNFISLYPLIYVQEKLETLFNSAYIEQTDSQLILTHTVGLFNLQQLLLVTK